jgi:hypothetical protein
MEIPMASHSDAHSDHHDRHDEDAGVNWMMYGNLLAMVATSTVLMYVFKYFNTYRWDDVWLSETRLYMAVMMGGMMLAVMLSFMLHMYKTRWVNWTIYAASSVLILLGLFLVRSQVTIQDVSWMKSMIPHHSIAVLTSERAELSDPRVVKLSHEIIAAQEKEIAEMAYLIRELKRGGEVGPDFPTGLMDGPAPVGTLEEALRRPAIATIDPSGMTEAEVSSVLGGPPVCVYRFSEGQATILAFGADGTGVMKVTGQLVPLTVSDPAAIPAGVVAATEGGGASVSVRRAVEGTDAEMIFEMTTEPALRAGYMGVYLCA